MRLPQGRRCDRPGGGRAHRLNPARHCTVPFISIDPPGTHFVSTPILSSVPAPAVVPPSLVQPCTHLCHCATCAPGVPLARLEAYRQKLMSPMSCEELPRDRCSLETEDMDEPQVDEVEEQVPSENSTGAITDLTLLKLGLEGETPALASAEGIKLQHSAEMESPGGEVQLQMPALGLEFGLELVRQRAEELEKLSGLAMEGQL